MLSFRLKKQTTKNVADITFKVEPNSANPMQTINTLAIPVVTYSFNIINWILSHITKMDKKIRELETCNRMHHPKADVERLYVPRREGASGLMQLEMNFKTTAIRLHKYLPTTNNWMIQLVLFYDAGKKAHSISKHSSKFKQKVNLQEQTNETVICTL